VNIPPTDKRKSQVNKLREPKPIIRILYYDIKIIQNTTKKEEKKTNNNESLFFHSLFILYSSFFLKSKFDQTLIKLTKDYENLKKKKQRIEYLNKH
jgi:hypothetical protein